MFSHTTFQLPGYGTGFTAFPALALTADTAAELALHDYDGTTNLLVSEVVVYINDYTPATGAAAGAKIELHQCADSGDIDSTGPSTTRLCEFIYEGQNVVILNMKESPLKVWIISNTTGTYQVTVKYLYKL